MSSVLNSGINFNNIFPWGSILVGAFGLCVGYSLKEFLVLIQRGSFSTIIPSSLNDKDDDYKMVILIRTDLNMTKGKIASQCCHACLAAYKDAMKNCPHIVKSWEGIGQPKITLKVESENELLNLVKKAKEMGLCARCIVDDGRTQVAHGTKTVAAIGPGKAKLIDYVTGNLKLF